jgi:phage antirepressor YoqD-like protein
VTPHSLIAWKAKNTSFATSRTQWMTTMVTTSNNGGGTSANTQGKHRDNSNNSNNNTTTTTTTQQTIQNEKVLVCECVSDVGRASDC